MQDGATTSSPTSAARERGPRRRLPKKWFPNRGSPSVCRRVKSDLAECVMNRGLSQPDRRNARSFRMLFWTLSDTGMDQ